MTMTEEEVKAKLAKVEGRIEVERQSNEVNTQWMTSDLERVK